MNWLGALAAVWVVSVLLAYLVGRDVGRRGFWYGFLLGPVGVALIVLLPRRRASRSRTARRLEQIGLLSLFGWHVRGGQNPPAGGFRMMPPDEPTEPVGDLYEGD